MQLETVDKSLFQKIHYFVNERMGLYFPGNREKDLVRGLSFAADTFGYKDVNTCIEQLISVKWTSKQIQTLASYLTIGETYFYRHKEQLDYIFSAFINNNHGRKKIRIWSSACCSGEEPYSLAIMYCENPYIKANYKLEILATDINPVFLKKAVSGIYTQHSLRVMPPVLTSKYFREIDKNKFELDDKIKNMVKFKYLNLASNTYPSDVNDTINLDIILCRNVFIYFQQSTIDNVVRNYRKCLNHDGMLLVAPAETFMVSADIMQKQISSPVTVFRKGKPAVKIKQNVTVYSNIFNKSREPVQTELFIKPEKAKQEIQNKSSLPQTIVNKLNKLYEDGKYNELLSEIKKIDIQTGTLDVQKKIYTLISHSYNRIGKFDNALKNCEKVIKLDKLNPDTYYFYATILIELNKTSEAVDAFRKVLYLEPSFIMAYFMIGNLLRAENQLAESTKHLKKVYNLLNNEEDDKIIKQSGDTTAIRLKENIIILLKAQGVEL